MNVSFLKKSALRAKSFYPRPVVGEGGAPRRERGLLNSLRRLKNDVALLLLFTAAQANASFQIVDGIRIKGENNVPLVATLMVPNSASAAQPAPAIVFVNSWALDNHEYLAQAAKLATKGYVVLSYATRGFGQSGGMVSVAGPSDIADFSKVLDWLIANTPTDPTRIGAAGISYGAGISLLGAGNDTRVKAVAAMSGWADLREALYGGETPDLVWGAILLGAGYLTGTMDPIIGQQYSNLVTHQRIPETLQWAYARSPQSVIQALNARQVPIYISNNFRDELFEPNAMMRFYSQLAGPKKLDLNLGNHATAELGGLVGLRNHVWGNVHRWFDRFLRQQANGVDTEQRVSMAVKLDQQRDNFSDWPSTEIKDSSFYLHERGWFSNGSLRSYADTSSGRDVFYSGILSGATAGVPVVSSIFEAHLALPIVTYLPTMNRLLSVVHESNTFNSTQKIRGIPMLDIWLRSSQRSYQTVAYLYSVDPFGFGTLITHGPVTIHNGNANQDRFVHIEMIATAYDLPAGHKLALALDNYDPQYSPPHLNAYEVNVVYGANRVSKLTLPLRR